MVWPYDAEYDYAIYLCSNCGEDINENDLIQYEGYWICPYCGERIDTVGEKEL